jgi:hypothetical protein
MQRLVYICLFFVLFIPQRIIFAAEPTPATTTTTDLNDATIELDACNGGIAITGQVCTTNGDITNKTIKPGTSTGPCHEDTDEETGKTTLVCVAEQTHTRDDVVIWGAKPAEDYDLKPHADMLEQARKPLTPLSIWNETVRNTNPQWPSWIARACDYKQQNDNPPELIRNDISKQRMKLGPDPAIPPTVEDLEYYKSIFSTLHVPEQNYQKAIELVKRASAYGCNTTKTAVDVQSTVQESQGKDIWDVLTIVFQTIWRSLEAKNHSYKIITETARMPYSEEMAGGLVQATDETLKDSRVSDVRKLNIKANAGIVETFRPCGLKFEPAEPNGQKLNEFQWENTGKTFTNDSRFHLTNLVDYAGNFMKSTLLPRNLQSDDQKITLTKEPCKGISYDAPSVTPAPPSLAIPAIPPNENNTIYSSNGNPVSNTPSCQEMMSNKNGQNMSKNTSTPLAAAITEAASWARVNPCILQGVANIEGATTEIASSQCVPNQCSAAGPFQITTGFTLKGTGNQCSKGDCTGCGSLKTCPNAVGILNQFKSLTDKFGSNLNPCDTRVAAHMSAALLVGKSNYFGQSIQGDISDPAGDISDPAVQQAIITAGDSYYGVPTALTRPGAWQGLSYGEYLLSQCVPGVVHKEHTMPTVTPQQ